MWAAAFLQEGAEAVEAVGSGAEGADRFVVADVRRDGVPL
jgi:hypothetical protein